VHLQGFEMDDENFVVMLIPSVVFVSTDVVVSAVTYRVSAAFFLSLIRLVVVDDRRVSA